MITDLDRYAGYRSAEGGWLGEIPEPDSDLHYTEQVPLLEDGGIEAFIRREVLLDELLKGAGK